MSSEITKIIIVSQRIMYFYHRKYILLLMFSKWVFKLESLQYIIKPTDVEVFDSKH